MSLIRVGNHVLERLGPQQYKLAYMLLCSLEGSKWLPVRGCTRCLKGTEVVQWRGHTVDIIDESTDPAHALYVYECWQIEDDRTEKMLAIRTCPNCKVVLESGDYLFFVPYCQRCCRILCDEKFCVHCGLGMAPGLFNDLKRKESDHVMVS